MTIGNKTSSPESTPVATRVLLAPGELHVNVPAGLPGVVVLDGRELPITGAVRLAWKGIS